MIMKGVEGRDQIIDAEGLRITSDYSISLQSSKVTSPEYVSENVFHVPCNK
jgi:hypothetical protein